MKKKPMILFSLCILGLFTHGCGGGSDSPSNNNQQSGGTPQQDPTILSPLVVDPAALSTEKIPLADVQYPNIADAGGDPLSAPAVIDPCSVLSAEELSQAVNTHSGNTFGSGLAFNTGVTDGSVCTYSADTHAIDVFINTPEVANRDIGLELPPTGAFSDLAEPWPTNGAVTIYVDNFLDLRYVYGAHTEAGDFGVYVSNRGGTGFDGTDNGNPYAEIALLAANVLETMELSPEQSESDSTLPDPCSYWTRTELETFLGYSLGDPVASDPYETDNIDCVYRGATDGLIVEIQVEEYQNVATDSFIPIDSAAGLFRTDEQSLFVILADLQYQIAIAVYETNGLRTLNTGPAAIALARNLADRVRE